MTISKAIELARIIYDNGKTLKINTFAELIGMKAEGGAFITKYNTLIKYGLIKKKDDVLSTTPLVKEIIYPLDENEKRNLLFKSFKNIPLYEDLIEKFKETSLPDDDNLKTLLIRQYDVNEKSAIPVLKGFIKSMKTMGIFEEETRKISLDFEEAENMIIYEEEIEQEERRDELKKGAQNKSMLNVKPISSILNKDILNLIIVFSSHLEPMNISTDEIAEFIANNENLTHTRIAFRALRDSIKNESITPDKLDILLDAIKQDLDIK